MEKREIIFLHFTLTCNMIIPIQIKPYDEIYKVYVIYKKQPHTKNLSSRGTFKIIRYKMKSWQRVRYFRIK